MQDENLEKEVATSDLSEIREYSDNLALVVVIIEGYYWIEMEKTMKQNPSFGLWT